MRVAIVIEEPGSDPAALGPGLPGQVATGLPLTHPTCRVEYVAVTA